MIDPVTISLAALGISILNIFASVLIYLHGKKTEERIRREIEKSIRRKEIIKSLNKTWEKGVDSCNAHYNIVGLAGFDMDEVIEKYDEAVDANGEFDRILSHKASALVNYEEIYNNLKKLQKDIEESRRAVGEYIKVNDVANIKKQMDIEKKHFEEEIQPFMNEIINDIVKLENEN